MAISINGVTVAGIGKDGLPGKDGKSAYDAAKAGGYTGTEDEFNQLLGNMITVSDQTPSDPVPINADTLGGKPASEYATKEEIGFINAKLDSINGEVI